MLHAPRASSPCLSIPLRLPRPLRRTAQPSAPPQPGPPLPSPAPKVFVSHSGQCSRLSPFAFRHFLSKRALADTGWYNMCPPTRPTGDTPVHRCPPVSERFTIAHQWHHHVINHRLLINQRPPFGLHSLCSRPILASQQNKSARIHSLPPTLLCHGTSSKFLFTSPAASSPAMPPLWYTGMCVLPSIFRP